MAVRLRKKVCMIGDFAVGKTSLVARFVNNVFSEKYLTTVGVKIDTKVVKLDSQREVKLVLWDIAGNDEFSTTAAAYLRGASGYLLVVDGTRLATLDAALRLKAAVDESLQHPPFLALFNKEDLQHDWEISMDSVADLRRQGWPIVVTSARTGHGVEEAFREFARRLAESP